MCNSCALCVCCFADDEKSHWNGTFFREIECSERSLSRSSCARMCLHRDSQHPSLSDSSRCLFVRQLLAVATAKQTRKVQVVACDKHLRMLKEQQSKHNTLREKLNIYWTLQCAGVLTTPKSLISLWRSVKDFCSSRVKDLSSTPTGLLRFDWID